MGFELRAAGWNLPALSLTHHILPVLDFFCNFLLRLRVGGERRIAMESVLYTIAMDQSCIGEQALLDL